jgi:hypothetical protein
MQYFLITKRTMMDEKSVKASAQSARGKLPPRERTHFKRLLVANPNYFGNLAGSPFKPVKIIAGNTTFEEVNCLGYNPSLDLLEATVQVKLPNGFDGDLCSPGSNEYVRFYVDYGSGWVDAGLVSFNTHDLPNQLDCAAEPDKPLSYVLTQPLDPQRNFCFFPELPKVRAILSWNVQPHRPAYPNPAAPVVLGGCDPTTIRSGVKKTTGPVYRPSNNACSYSRPGTS